MTIFYTLKYNKKNFNYLYKMFMQIIKNQYVYLCLNRVIILGRISEIKINKIECIKHRLFLSNMILFKRWFDSAFCDCRIKFCYEFHQ